MKVAGNKKLRKRLNFVKHLNLSSSDNLILEPSIDIAGIDERLTAKVDRPPDNIDRLIIIELREDDPLSKELGIRCGWAGIWAEDPPKPKTRRWRR